MVMILMLVWSAHLINSFARGSLHDDDDYDEDDDGDHDGDDEDMMVMSLKCSPDQLLCLLRGSWHLRYVKGVLTTEQL